MTGDNRGGRIGGDEGTHRGPKGLREEKSPSVRSDRKGTPHTLKIRPHKGCRSDDLCTDSCVVKSTRDRSIGFEWMQYLQVNWVSFEYGRAVRFTTVREGPVKRGRYAPGVRQGVSVVRDKKTSMKTQ